MGVRERRTIVSARQRWVTALIGALSVAVGALAGLPAATTPVAASPPTASCGAAAAPDRSVDLLSDERTWYDGATTFGTTLSRGDATKTEQVADWVAGAPVYAQRSRSTYDANGRVREAFDAIDRRTATAYTPASGGPVTRTVVTNPKGWTTTTDLAVAWGLPADILDVNGHRTDLAYGGLGRLTAVWLPGRDRATQSADTTFAYAIRNSGAPTSVATTRLNTAGTGTITSYALYDGQLRPRQTQSPVNGGGRVVTETLYDSRGLTAETRSPYFNSGSPVADLFQPNGPSDVPERTLTVFDGAERATASITQVDAVERWRTTTAYGGDHTDVTAPAGGTGTSTWVDGRGQTVALWQYHSPAADTSAAHDTATYAYTRAGDLSGVTDTSGTAWRWTYDLRRRQITAHDPDRGDTTLTHDDAGQLLTTTDARGVTLAFTNDELGRRTAEAQRTATGDTPLAGWTFDTLARGQLTSSSGTTAGSTTRRRSPATRRATSRRGRG